MAEGLQWLRSGEKFAHADVALPIDDDFPSNARIPVFRFQCIRNEHAARFAGGDFTAGF